MSTHRQAGGQQRPLDDLPTMGSAPTVNSAGREIRPTAQKLLAAFPRPSMFIEADNAQSSTIQNTCL